jgi:hypothetical protein
MPATRQGLGLPLALALAAVALLAAAIFLALSPKAATPRRPTPTGGAVMGTWAVAPETSTTGEQRVNIVGDVGVLDCGEVEPGSVGINVVRRSDRRQVSLDFCRAAESEKFLMRQP